MPSRKRRSLQSLLIPGLFHVEDKSASKDLKESTEPTQFHTWGHSSISPWVAARHSPPPDFLQDEDPFANLASPTKSPTVEGQPPKSPTADSQTPISPSKSPSSSTAPTLSSPLASPVKIARIPHVPDRSSSSRPVYKKPAFPSHPSLPSLDSLARMNVIIPPRIRKGRVGATLPVEPWDLPPTPTTPASPIDLGSTFLDLSADDDEEDEPTFSEEYVPAQSEEVDRSLDSEDLESRPSLTRTSSSSDHSLSSTSSASSSESLGEEGVYDDSTNYLNSSTAGILNPSFDHPLFSFPSFSSEYLWEPQVCSSTPHTSILFSEIEDDDLTDPTAMFEPGTSAGTIRAAMTSWDTRPLRRTAMLQNTWSEEPTDSTGGWEQQQGHGGWTTSTGTSNNRGSYGWNDSSYGHGGGAGDAGEDGRDNGRKPPTRPSYSHVSSSETSSDDDEEEGESANDAQSRVQNSSDDDIPLAQRIPTALKAQRTIRIKAREERERRRKERAERVARGEPPRDLRPVRAGTSHHASPAMSGSQANVIQAIQRQRAQTLGGGSHPFAFEDLNKRLQNIQTMSPRSRHRGLSDEKDRLVSQSIPSPPTEHPRTLRPMRSFHREDQRTSDISTPPPAETSLSRSSTRAKARKSEEASIPPLPPVDASSLQPELERKPTKLVKSPERTRPSLDSSHPPLPPILGHISKSNFSQRRVFVGDMQRFHMVEIGSTTTASDVIQMVDDQGGLKGWVGSGGWMVWEVAQDFGMERPVRSYELLADVEASWNKDKTVNTFVIRLTPLESLLSRSAMPTCSPIAGGYVEWQVKRGKWTKRWLALREHNLYLAKRDNGKDETLLCSLSNFDFYKVKSLVKAPKPFVFAVKSTDNLSFFEDTADYLHLFSCNENDGAKWMEKILLARSYVLHQERNALFNPKTATSGATSLSRAPTRKSTPSSRVTPSKIQSPMPGSKAQPLVNLDAHNVFEPGSLLSK